jgi:hypothetical protein
MKSHAIRDGFHLLWACIREGSSYQVWRLFHPRAGKRAKSLSENPLKP